MASTACFLHHHALSTPTRLTSQRQLPSLRPTHQIVCRAQKQAQAPKEEDAPALSRRLALTVLIGAAAIGSKVSPADAAYGEAGNSLPLCYFRLYNWMMDPEIKLVLHMGNINLQPIYLGNPRTTPTSCHTTEMDSSCRYHPNGIPAKRGSSRGRCFDTRITSTPTAMSPSLSLPPTRNPSLTTVPPKSSSPKYKLHFSFPSFFFCHIHAVFWFMCLIWLLLSSTTGGLLAGETSLLWQCQWGI